MADIDFTSGNAGTKLPNYVKAGQHTLKKVIDYAEALEKKESALAAGDVLQVFTIPAGCIIHAAGLTPKVVADSDSLALDLGDTDAGAAVYTDGTDGTALTDGVPVMTAVQKYYPAANTLDLTLQAITGVLTTGKVLVWCIVTEASI